MTAPAPPIGPRGLYLRAWLEGNAAGTAGAHRAECPYAASRPFTRRAWLVGYSRAQLEAKRAPEVDVDDAAPWPGDA